MRCPANLEIQSYIDGELDDNRATQIAGHIEHCQPCQGLARNLTTTSTLLHCLAELPSVNTERHYASGYTAAAIPKRLPRWVLVPAAACFLVALGVSWRYVAPTQNKTTYISAFVEAHRTMPAIEDLPEPCDFGLGGYWE